MNRKILWILFLISLPYITYFPFGSLAGQQNIIKIKLGPDETLRSLAKKYFGDPNEWEVILRYNGFQRLEEIRPGTEFLIPVKLYENMATHLKKIRHTVSLANREGAGILAKNIIESSLKLERDALALKKQGKLKQAEKNAAQALGYAEKALSETKKKRIRSVTAVMFRKYGTVQSRKPDQPMWRDIAKNQELLEKERIRTLTGSRAEILFTDGSQLKLGENSLAVIEAMKEDIVDKSGTTSVVVLRGDVLAQLTALNTKNIISVTSPEVATHIRSRNFRTTRDKKDVMRIANYDGEIDVRARGERITIEKNEGTKVAPGKRPDQARKLLRPPLILSPVSEQKFFVPEIPFEWEPVRTAKLYKLEIASGRTFSHIIEETALKTTTCLWKAPEKGVYYFRMYSIDKDNFAGPFSEPVEFFVDIDVTPPYLVLSSPSQEEVIFSDDVLVRGTAESNARIWISDKAVVPEKDGSFSHLLRLNQGPQMISVRAEDAAGNRTLVTRNVFCNMENQLVSLDVPAEMTVNRTQVFISGKTRPLTRLEINGKAIPSSEKFSHLLELSEGDHTVMLRATSPRGKTQTLPVLIKVDLTPPEINMADFPSYTNETELMLSGKLSEDATLRINSRTADLKDRRFELHVRLGEGRNTFVAEAEDPAGNRTDKSLTILRDTRPPEITGHSISSPTIWGGEILTVEVRAEDKGAGLIRTGSFVIDISPDHNEFSGILTLRQGANMFEGSVFIPPEVRGEAKIKKLHIRDRLGNEVILP